MASERELELLAVIEKARGWLSSSQDLRDRIGSALYVLATVDTSALAEYRRQVIEECAQAIVEVFPTTTDPDAAEYLDGGADAWRAVGALAEKGADK